MDITVKSQVARQAFAHHIQTVPMAVQIVNQPPGRPIPRDTKNVPPQNVIHRHAYAVKKQNTDARPDIMVPPQMANLVVHSARHQTEYRPHQTPAQHLSHNAICHLAQPALTPPAHLYTQQTAIIKNTQTSRNRGIFFLLLQKNQHIIRIIIHTKMYVARHHTVAQNHHLIKPEPHHAHLHYKRAHQFAPDIYHL